MCWRQGFLSPFRWQEDNFLFLGSNEGTFMSFYLITFYTLLYFLTLQFHFAVKCTTCGVSYIWLTLVLWYSKICTVQLPHLFFLYLSANSHKWVVSWDLQGHHMSLFLPSFLYTAPDAHFQASVAIPCPYSVLLQYMKIINGVFFYAEKASISIIYTKIKKSLHRSR